MSGRSVAFALPDTGPAEADAAREVVLDGWLTTGRRCRQLEQAFAERVGAPYAVALNSCTAGLHLALDAVGVRRGDIVVTSPYTFAATAEVVRYFDALPVFVDVEPSTCNIDCDALEDLLERLAAGDRRALPPLAQNTVEPTVPRALIAVHVGGVPCDLERLYKMAAAYNMAVVEDAAHAFPSSAGFRMVGAPAPGDVPAAACFSFYATKTITTGEGGMLVTDRADIAERVRQMSLHGLSHDAWTRYGHNGSWEYDIVAPGFKYNLTDIAAAIGLVQLRRADELTARRSIIARRYDERLRGVPGVETPRVPADVSSSWHLYMLRLRPAELTIGRNRFIEELRARGVGTSVHFKPLHLHSYYRGALGYAAVDFPNAVSEFEREISLPIYSRMSDDDVEYVAHAVADVATRHAA